ncbi:oligosaccharide repeat unit polymerase [Parageobacillus sp. VR-IP]|uniref:O-antigen polymerase n=1 Tax=Parageobacillus sp. VR-IP TaxID=2742205 RepID=UPI001581A3EB|nr:O-antigen polymerase [Parageobacillus sp. VR-IP]NUK29894.1 oligosaccharide repeat unit polymerase [Parageobacillus sp. VR-IP]
MFQITTNKTYNNLIHKLLLFKLVFIVSVLIAFYPIESLTIVSLLISLFLLYFFKRKFHTFINPVSFLFFIFIIGYIIRFYYLYHVENKMGISNDFIVYSFIFSIILISVLVIGLIIGLNVRITKDYILNIKDNKFVFRIIWFNAFISIGNVIFLLLYFGGPQNFIKLLSNRTENFLGLSWAFFGLCFLSISILIFYANDMNILKYTKVKILFLISIGLCLLTGSRMLIFLILFSYIMIKEKHRKSNYSIKFFLKYGILFLIFYICYFAYFRVYLPTGSWNYFAANYKTLLINTIMNGGTSFLDGLGVVMENMPSNHHFLGGKTLFASITMVIPRSIFPNKPELGSAVYNYLFNHDQYLRGTGQNPSLFGELYMNFGPFGTIILIFMIGIFLGLVFRYQRTTNNSIFFLLSVFLLPSLFLYLKSGFGTATFLRLLFPFFVNLILLYLLNKLKREVL